MHNFSDWHLTDWPNKAVSITFNSLGNVPMAKICCWPFLYGPQAVVEGLLLIHIVCSYKWLIGNLFRDHAQGFWWPWKHCSGLWATTTTTRACWQKVLNCMRKCTNLCALFQWLTCPIFVQDFAFYIMQCFHRCSLCHDCIRELFQSVLSTRTNLVSTQTKRHGKAQCKAPTSAVYITEYSKNWIVQTNYSRIELYEHSIFYLYLYIWVFVHPCWRRSIVSRRK